MPDVPSSILGSDGHISCFFVFVFVFFSRNKKSMIIKKPKCHQNGMESLREGNVHRRQVFLSYSQNSNNTLYA